MSKIVSLRQGFGHVQRLALTLFYPSDTYIHLQIADILLIIRMASLCIFSPNFYIQAGLRRYQRHSINPLVSGCRNIRWLFDFTQLQT